VLASQRRLRIAQELQHDGAVRVADLVALLGVSDMTVRRDLEAMQRSGLLTKVHGGAIVPGNRMRRRPLRGQPRTSYVPVTRLLYRPGPRHGRWPGGFPLASPC
jgi:DeoR/GlpR family transcriptional regulator of sugar metabolism